MFGTPDTQATAGLIKDGNEQTFLQDVIIDRSQVVDVTHKGFMPSCNILTT